MDFFAFMFFIFNVGVGFALDDKGWRPWQCIFWPYYLGRAVGDFIAKKRPPQRDKPE